VAGEDVVSADGACRDCGVDTTPLDARVGSWEWYVLRNEVWARVIGEGDLPAYGGGGLLCIGCVEKRLGRELNAGDFDWSVPLNALNLVSDLPSLRLLDRMNA
jgi:hypothetical protein